MSILVLMLIFGALFGIWRLVDGESWVPAVLRISSFFAFFIANAFLMFWPHPYQIICAITGGLLLFTALEKGTTDWTSWREMWKHFLWREIFITCCPVWWVLSVAAGLMWPLFSRTNLKGWDFYARFFGGFLMGAGYAYFLTNLMVK